MHLLASGHLILDSNAQRIGLRFLENPGAAYPQRRGQIFRFALISYGKGVAEPCLDPSPKRSLNCGD